jgi:putative ABC transport system permease protein
MKLAAIALRNLARNRRRTLLSLLVTAAGAAGLVVTAGFIRFSFAGLEQAIIRGGLGHLEVVPTELATLSLSERSGLPSLSGWEDLRRAIERTPGVRAAGAAIHLAGVVSKGERSAPFLGAGVEPDRERLMGLELKLRGGKDLPAQAPPDGSDVVLLGLGLARALEAQAGDVVTVLALTPSGNLNAVDMKVSGVFTTGLQEIDSRMLKLHLASAQRLLESSNVSSILVGLADAEQTGDVRDRLQRELTARHLPVTVLDWQTRAPFYGQVRALYSAIFVFLGSIIFVMVCLAASNSLLMSVMERVREIGTLLALGTSRAQVAVLILWEAFWLGLGGGLLGAALGVAISASLRAARVTMPPPPGAVDPMLLELWIRPVDILGIVALMLLVLLVAAAVPVAKAVRLRIVEALAHV